MSAKILVIVQALKRLPITPSIKSMTNSVRAVSYFRRHYSWFLRATLLTSFCCISFPVLAQDEDINDPIYLDGYVGLGGAILHQFSSQEEGTRQNIKVEFARLRKWISIDARVGLGQGYSDFGGLFRFYKHWKFDKDSATGISLGAGIGAMYSQGVSPVAGEGRKAFVDVIGAPFVRFIWDWGNGVGLGIDAEYQLVPYTMYTDDTGTDSVDDVRELRNRVFLGVSLLIEVD